MAHFFSCPCHLRPPLQTFGLDAQDCLPVQRHNVCTSFDEECVSVHVPPVRPTLASSSSFVPLSLLLLVIHVLLVHLIHNNGTNIQRIVAPTVNFILKLMILPTKSYRDRWFHVSLGVAESQQSWLGKGSPGRRTRFSVENSFVHECSTVSRLMIQPPVCVNSLVTYTTD